MTDRPIIFSAPMVRALLDGRKTQTRRLLKKPAAIDALAVFGPAFMTMPGNVDLIGYAPGDRLWVRETHYLTDDGESEYAVFAADQGDVDEHLASMQTTMASHPSIDWSKHLRLRPSIHMPRWASRLTLTVTEVRVQRLQDISEADAVAEGIQPHGDLFTGYGKAADQWMGPLDSFASLWISLHGYEGWDENPWIVALTFDVARQNIDQMPGVAG